MKLDLQMFAEGDKTISLANLQKFKEKCDETYAKIGSEYNVLDLGALTDGQTITLNDDQLALFQADNTVIKITFNEVMTYLFKSYAQTYADVLRGDVYAMFIPSFDGVTALSIHSTNNQVQLTQNTFNYASDNDFNQIQQWAKDTTTKIPNSKLNIDSELSSTSTNAVQNKVVNEALNNTIKKTGSSEAQIIQGDISIQGDLTVSGTTITANTETLVVKDNMIVTNSDGTTLSNLSGLFIKTGTSSGYAIVYDPSSNSVILGEGTIDSSNEVTVVASERKAIATRMDSQAIKNDNVLVWDDALKVLKDGGFSKTIVDSKYVKPSGGIPKTDLASVVQSSLNKADSALQSVPNASTTVKGIALLGASGGSARYNQKADVGLGNVVNTGDSATPVSGGTTKFTTGGAYTMQSTLQTAINGKANASEVVKKANLSENVNFNDVTEGGMYRYGSSITNGPDGAGSHGQLLVVRGANDTIAQLCFPYSDSRMFLRTGNAVNNPNGTWQDWVAIASTNDLNNYLPLSGGQVNGNLSVYGPPSNGIIKVKSTTSYESGIGFYNWDTAKLTFGICEDIDNKLGLYDNANTYGGGAKWYVLATEDYVNDNMPKSALVWRGHSTNVTGLSLDTNSFYMIQLYCDVPQAVKTIIVKPSVTGISGLIGFSYNNYRFYGNTFHLSLNTSICSISSNNGNGFGINSSGNGVVGLSGLPVYITFIYKIL